MLKPNAFLALAAVGWADGNLDATEGQGLLSAAAKYGMAGSDLAAIEQAIRSPVTIADVDTMGMSRGERAITFALATWMAHLDGVVTASESATLILLGDRLGIPLGIRQRAGDAAMQVAEQSAGRPDKYDFEALEQRLRAKLGDLDAE